MRYIKFRAFDKVKNRMCNVQTIGFMTNMIVIQFGDEVGEARPFTDVILEEFTGIILEGIEVFEGDKVLTDEVGWIGNVTWDDDESRWWLTDVKGGFCGDLSAWKKVVGNIHE